ncbi:hypothetical protein [Calorimonas adulescens]|uniref:Uncharacterized protein n=1 Tax=Calorimonas adulescens TaxID=2606906 RepID=A0A5D8Q812_9THEO|nr:hypothetical protein [Calorimonas adulescens]TZE80780.1 hypothetical protein FWJ32_12215 [Calorimonas adulescens]
MKKRILGFVTAVLLCVSFLGSTTVFAADDVAQPHPDSEVRNINLNAGGEEYGIEPQTDGYYYWDVESTTNQGTTYGSWRLGPQGDGPGTIGVNKTDTVSNTISGSYTSVGDISAALGVSIGVSKSYSVKYSLEVPLGKTYQIIYRPLFTKYKVVQRQYYRIDGYSTPTSNTKTCYVEVFYDWGFSYIEV